MLPLHQVVQQAYFRKASAPIAQTRARQALCSKQHVLRVFPTIRPEGTQATYSFSRCCCAEALSRSAEAGSSRAPKAITSWQCHRPAQHIKESPQHSRPTTRCSSAETCDITNVQSYLLLQAIVVGIRDTRSNKRECEMLGNHVSSIGVLLDDLAREPDKLPKTAEPTLENLVEALKKAERLVQKCCKKSAFGAFVSSSNIKDDFIEVRPSASVT